MYHSWKSRSTGMHGRIDVAEGPFVGGQLAVGMHVPLVEEQACILIICPPDRVPGQRGERARMRHIREGRAQLRLPQPQSRVLSPTGKHVSIRSKGQTADAAGLPA